ncbi:hypothetical protein [Pseudonocardia spinosispora]|uniref:hypothetical protein n=1 Tax=Pseudonocardia spinosispora TaxID=103441 RepID=UPI0012ECB7A3|nr:hypothetical protein [Pseudonocardia spinosispora]
MRIKQQQRRRELRARLEATRRARAGGGPAPRVTRLWLSVGYLLCVASDSVAALLFPERIAALVWFAGFLIGMGLLIMMTMATRRTDELDGEGFYSRAYMILSIVCFVAFGVIVVLHGIFPPPIEYRLTEAVMWPLVLLVFGLPTLIACWSLPDSDHSAE